MAAFILDACKSIYIDRYLSLERAGVVTLGQ